MHPVLLSGFADEAAKPIARQIEAHRALGWGAIDLRKIDGTDATLLTDEAFDRAASAVHEAGLAITSLGSPYGTGASRITHPFEPVLESLTRSLARMRRHHIPFLRVMTWPNDGLASDAWRDEALRRTRALAERCADAGVILTIENCAGWAAQSPAHLIEFLERLAHPAVRVAYDTGNPASHGKPDTWPWYLAAKPWIAHLHVKSHTGRLSPTDSGRHVWPAEGVSRVADTVTDLLASGFAGPISIEPHLGQPGMSDDERFATYLEYGRRFDSMRNQIVT
jgi:sugar phosphate isomerase/epimerase